MRSSDPTQILRSITDQSHHTVLDVLGLTVEFLNSPEGNERFTVMRGTIPPGVTVPLHSHDDVESFFVLSGAKQALVNSSDGLEWTDVVAGDFVYIEPGEPHALRNRSSAPVIELIITSGRLGRWFREVGIASTGVPHPPTTDDLTRLIAVSAKYGYWLATPEENAAHGIELSSPVVS